MLISVIKSMVFFSFAAKLFFKREAGCVLY